jgi:hypothetical protein
VAQSHSSAFIAFRNLVVSGLEEEDRRRLTALFGCMHDPKPPISSEVVAVLRAFVALPSDDRRRVVRWFGRYVSRWGQIPAAASQSVVTPAAGSSPIDSPGLDPA